MDPSAPSCKSKRIQTRKAARRSVPPPKSTRTTTIVEKSGVATAAKRTKSEKTKMGAASSKVKKIAMKETPVAATASILHLTNEVERNSLLLLSAHQSSSRIRTQKTILALRWLKPEGSAGCCLLSE
ncbi:hypothetical protein ACA910_006162 [Epithemia clementina (nom. ined.)]